MLIEQGRYDLAMDEVRRALGEDPNDGALYALLAVCHLNREQHREALEQAERAVHLEPDDWWSQYVLAEAQRGMRRYDEAIETAKRSAALEPDASAPHVMIGQVHLQKSRWRDALQSADHALSLDPANTDAANVRAIALTQLGDRSAAAQTIDASLDRDPENALTHANRGWALLHAGQPREAMEHFAEALRLEPGHEWARQGIVEAMKARNIVYRGFLRVALALGRMTPRARFIAFIGVIVLLQIMVRLPDGGPLQLVGVILALAYMAFVVFMWSSRPLFDAILMVDKFGRLALTGHEKRAAAFFVSGLALSTTYITVGLLYRGSTIDALDYLIVTLAAGVAASVPPHGQWKIGYAAATTAYVLAGIYCFRWMTHPAPFADGLDAVQAWHDAATTTDAQRADLLEFIRSQTMLNNIFVWGSIAMTWLSGALHRRPTPR